MEIGTGNDLCMEKKMTGVLTMAFGLGTANAQGKEPSILPKKNSKF